MTLEEIDASIAALEAAKTERLIGGVRTKVAYSNGSVEKQVGSIEEINMEITRLQLLRSRLTGQSTGGGPIRIGFGDRV